MTDSDFAALIRVERPEEGWLRFSDPASVERATDVGEVSAMLARTAAAVDDGAWAVGFLRYEAASAFDPAFPHRPAEAPVAAFGIFEPPRRIERLPPLAPDAVHALGNWIASQGRREHERAVLEILAAIGRGDVYQVNHTMRLSAPWSGDSRALFYELWRAQPAPHAAWLRLGDIEVCSVSPELFFELTGGRVVTRPMKGTRRRTGRSADDQALAQSLRDSAKDRAENLMIVDMMRNDLGRVARPGSVATTRLFDVAPFGSVLQMTSTVEAATEARWDAVLAALFPAASITGAPKAAAMRIVDRLEPQPRGVYTGCIGCIAPTGDARFSVAIRTVEIDRRRGRALYGTGGGIVWDSRAEDEYREALTKALVVRDSEPPMALLETLRWEPGEGFTLLEGHLDRLAASADRFARPCDVAAARVALDEAVVGARETQRVPTHPRLRRHVHGRGATVRGPSGSLATRGRRLTRRLRRPPPAPQDDTPRALRRRSGRPDARRRCRPLERASRSDRDDRREPRRPAGVGAGRPLPSRAVSCRG